MNQYFSLYTDGSHMEILNVAGVGGYLLDSENKKVWEFSEKIQEPALYSKHEIMALESGLKKCISSGVTHLKCFTDDKAMSNILNTKDKNILQKFVSSNGTLSRVVKLLDSFEDISFYYTPRNENKLADKLSRKFILANTEEKTAQVLDHAVIPNLYCTEQFHRGNKKDFLDMRRGLWGEEEQVCFLFDMTHITNTLDTYKIIRHNGITIKEKTSQIMPSNWTAEYVRTISNTLKDCTEKNVLLILKPQGNIVDDMIRGLAPLTKKAKVAMGELMEVTKNFHHIIVHNDGAILDTVFPPRVKVEKTISDKEMEIIQAMKILGDDNYQIGQRLDLEKKYPINESRTTYIGEIQKKYFGEFMKMMMKQEEVVLRKRGPVSKEDLQMRVDKIAEIREKLTSQGVKLHM